MNRKFIFIAIAVLSAAFTIPLCAQEASHAQASQNIPAPRQLIAWSNLQKPHPVPQPLPPPDTPVPPPDQSNRAPKPADPQTQQTPTQTFVGKISKDGNGYVLKVTSDTEYKLAGVDASRYDDKNVKVTGQLEQGTKTIHVASIELAS